MRTGRRSEARLHQARSRRAGGSLMPGSGWPPRGLRQARLRRAGGSLMPRTGCPPWPPWYPPVPGPVAAPVGVHQLQAAYPVAVELNGHVQVRPGPGHPDRGRLTLVLGRRARWHDRWLAARYLAERLRSGVFLAAVGGGNDLRTAESRTPSARSGPPETTQPDPNREWVERAFREIYWRARRSPVAESEVPALRELLTEAWIDNQVAYHDGVSEQLSRRQRRLSWLAVTLFSVSALVALLHSMNVFQSASGPDSGGTAPWSYSGRSRHQRLQRTARVLTAGRRSRLMASRLRGLRSQVEHPGRLSSLQRTAASTELLMRAETADWYEVVRLHDFEVPS